MLAGCPQRTDDPAMDEEEPQAPQPGERISYQSFGENFIRYLVTVPRLRGEIEDALRRTVDGSVRALPKDLLVADYQFQPDALHIGHRDLEDGEVCFALELSGRFDLTLRLVGMPVKAPMQVEIRVDVDVHTLYPLTIRLLPHRVRSSNIRVQLLMPRELRALPTQLLDRINPLVLAVREGVVREVNAQLRREDLAEMATIDVLALAEGAMGVAQNSTRR
jgi:hypothetical protein